MGAALIILDQINPTKVYVYLKPKKEVYSSYLDKIGGFSKEFEKSPLQTLKRKIKEELDTSQAQLKILKFKVFISGIGTNESTFMYYTTAGSKIKSKNGPGFWISIKAIRNYLKGNSHTLQKELVGKYKMNKTQAAKMRLNPHLLEGLKAYLSGQS